MFDVTTIPMTTNRRGERIVEPDNLYPTVIVRIKEALTEYRRQEAAGEIDIDGIVPELVTTPGRGGNARAKILLRNALALPEKAWDDALRPRTEFHPIEYKTLNMDMMRSLGISEEGLAQIQEVKDRGDALEVAYGWFAHALRLAIGSFSLTIGSGAPAGSDPSDVSLRPYRL
jgi:hypothetical protein